MKKIWFDASRMKLLAASFTVFLLLVIVLADAGVLSHYVGFIYAFPFGDKAGHFILYGILAWLIDLAMFRSLPDRNRGRLAVQCSFVLILLIGLEEVSQQYFSSRTFDLVDLTFSYLGVVFFSLAAITIK